MLPLAPVSGARLASLATGQGGLPSAGEWPIVLVLLAILAFAGTRLLMAAGLTRAEGILVAAGSPLLVLVDLPLGRLGTEVGLAANATGCIIPTVVAVKMLVERRFPVAESTLLVGVGIVIAFLSSHAIPDRGVMLQYRIPALVVGLLAAATLFRTSERAGAAAFCAGAIGVVVGADFLRLSELATGGSGRVVLGGAGLLDGIFLVAVLGAVVAQTVSVLLRTLLRQVAAGRPAA